MAEWSKALDSKSSRPQKGLEGSNPSLTATSLASDVAPPLPTNNGFSVLICSSVCGIFTYYKVLKILIIFTKGQQMICAEDLKIITRVKFIHLNPNLLIV